MSIKESVGGDGTWREEERVVANGDSRSDDNIGGANGGTSRAGRRERRHDRGQDETADSKRER